MTARTASAAGGVYDVGYRPYDGPRGGRVAARAALWRLSVRRAVGLRRSWRQKVLPWLLLGVSTIPAIINVGVKYLTKDTPGQAIELITYREYVGVSTALLPFVALTAPDIICPDRRNRVLPLLFARPINGTDYVIAKVAAIASVVFAFSFMPQVVLFVGQMLVATDGALDYFTDNAEVLWQVPVAVAGLALYYAAIGVALAATTTRRVVGGVALLATVLVTSAVGNILVEVHKAKGPNVGGSAWAVIDVLAIPLHVRDLVFLGHLDSDGPMAGVGGGGAMVLGAYVVVVVVSMAFLLRRYRESPLVVTTDPAFVDDASVEVSAASVWFGPKVALTEVGCSFGPGVTGLLGPNGAGKTTLMRAITGLLPLNQGTVRVGGLDPRGDRAAERALALVPEEDVTPGVLTARQLVRYAASLHAVRDRAAADDALATVALLDVADRRLGGFSKGMRQRARIAAALVGGPSVLVLDEPLNGADPVQRVALIDLFNRLAAEGRTVVVSSHVLHEVERLARRHIVLVRGRVAAAGDHRAIRNAMADRPRRVLVRTPHPRVLAAALVGERAVTAVALEDGDIIVSSASARRLAKALPGVARRVGASLLEVRPLDDTLEATFRELLR